MSIWLLSAILMLPPLAIPVAVAMRATANNRLAAVQLGSIFAAPALAMMTFAFDQPSFIDLALCLTLLSVPGTLLFTMFMERWL